MNWVLNVWMVLSALLALWLPGGTNCYLMSMLVMVFLSDAEASLSMTLNPVSNTQVLRFMVNSVNTFIIYLSLLFFIVSVRISLPSHT